MITDLSELTPEKALIFRVTHIDNVPWVLANGLHCMKSKVQDQNFVSIGNTDLIQKRTARQVPAGPGETLAHYVPFYFTPCSPMLYNIRTGWAGIAKRSLSELVFLAVSLRSLEAHGVPFVFADRHAYLAMAKFSNRLADLDNLAWRYWQSRDFKRDANDPGKTERYQAEALIHRHLPAERIEAIVCSRKQERATVAKMVQNHGKQIQVVCRKDWFF